jgi:hypothetical protein
VKSRLIASLIHLAISCAVALIAMIVVFYVWYPAPLDSAIGVTKIYYLLLAVDITLGPLITFIVFKKGKKYLKLDLVIIAILQLSALCYGMNTLFVGRPVYIVFNVDRFDITKANEIDPASYEKAQKQNNQAALISWFGPKWVGAIASKDNKRNQEIMLSAVQGGADWPQLPELFVPLAEVQQQMLEKAKSLSELRKLHNNDFQVTDKLSGWQDDEVKWLPLRGPIKNIVVLIDKKSSSIIKTLEINPWP